MSDLINFSGRIVYPTSSTYEVDRSLFNKKLDIKPLVIFFCENTEDVQIALNHARKRNTPIRIRSGRHSFEGLSMANNAVVIDVSGINFFELSKDRTKVKIGAGNDAYTVCSKLWQHHLMIPLGSCPTVSVVGQTLGGGIGFSSRLMGLASDNVIEIEIITADGRLLTVNSAYYPDLFWALRGAGNGNFGIVTALTFKTHSVSNVAIYKIDWSWETLCNVGPTWFGMLQTMPKELMSYFCFGQFNKEKAITSFGQYFGSAIELKKIVSPLLKFSEKNFIINELPYMEVIDSNFWEITPKPMHPDHYKQDAHKHRMNFKAASLFLKKPLLIKTLKMIDRYYTQPNLNLNLTMIESHGGNISSMAKNFSAFPHRDNIAYMQILVAWEDDNEEQHQLNWLKNYYTIFAEYGAGAYSNCTDLELNDYAERYYLSNLDTIKQAKQKYDPHNIFNHAQSIPITAR